MGVVRLLVVEVVVVDVAVVVGASVVGLGVVIGTLSLIWSSWTGVTRIGFLTLLVSLWLFLSLGKFLFTLIIVFTEVSEAEFDPALPPICSLGRSNIHEGMFGFWLFEVAELVLRQV